MNFAWKMITFWFILNLATGLTMRLVPGLMYYGSTPGGLKYEEGAMTTFNNEMQGYINPESIIEDKQDQVSRVLDMLSLGLWTKFTYLYNNYLMGGVTFVEQIYNNFVGSTDEDEFGTFLFGLIKTLTTFVYIFAVLSLFGNKNPTGAESS